MKMPELQEVVGYYCNKCGKFPDSSEHEGCSYLAVGVPRGYTKAEVQAYTKQALIDLLEEAAKECMASELIDMPTRHEIAVVRKCAAAITSSRLRI
jgi:hypothetical protein